MDKQLATEYAAKVRTSAMNLQSDARKPLMFVITDSTLSIMSNMIVLMVTIQKCGTYTHAYDCCRDAAFGTDCSRTHLVYQAACIFGCQSGLISGIAHRSLSFHCTRLQGRPLHMHASVHMVFANISSFLLAGCQF